MSDEDKAPRKKYAGEAGIEGQKETYKKKEDCTGFVIRECVKEVRRLMEIMTNHVRELPYSYKGVKSSWINGRGWGRLSG